ncbi:hypothetical protein MKZ38_009141 [Zalerion maritima]|uniref:Small ribosomal subunit protein mS38 n=1 Tax=Zalerion maritima TaxID=339359 RepID=A0AAD5RGG5_9PEZI|nr:hypothetical protein MKZ38_009141 [Zalerion maritima]
MWPSSVRRVATVACQSTSILSAIGPAASTVGLGAGGRRHASPARYGSSKASSSDNGPKKAAADGSVAQAVDQETKPGGEKRKRKSKAAKPATKTKDLPSVPSTSHLSQQSMAPELTWTLPLYLAIAITSFFSLHRPISVTDGFPTTVSDDMFASIFANKQRHRTSEVISTLSDTVDELEQPMASITISTNGFKPAGYSEMGDNMIQLEHALPRLLDQLDSMSGKFSPYASPPTPKDKAAVEASIVEKDGEATTGVVGGQQETNGDQHIRYKAMVTVDQTTKPDGRIEMVAHSPVLLQDEEPQRRGRRRWDLISVKRLRKLKMKKKKYKKLMRRTRNERRKLDRL